MIFQMDGFSLVIKLAQGGSLTNGANLFRLEKWIQTHITIESKWFSRNK